MDIEVTAYTCDNPLEHIGLCAGVSTDRTVNNKRRAINCWKAGHTNVFEHITATIYVDGVSRTCTHQLVRHRLMSFVEQSQRYTKPDMDSDDWYVVPSKVAQDDEASFLFDVQMHSAADAYQNLLDAGMKPEDARFVLPGSCKTSIVLSSNMRELASFWNLRSDPHAQWEIRELAYGIRDELHGLSPEWSEMIDLAMPIQESES